MTDRCRLVGHPYGVRVVADLSPAALALIAVVGFAAGAANSLAGGGTLIAYPTLLALGIPPITANITCSVGLIPGYAGSAWAYRRELKTHRSLAPRLLIAAVIGGLLGAALLLAIPDRGFEVVVPPLVALAVVLLTVQPRLAAWVKSRTIDGVDRAVPIGLLLAVVACGMYGSFFGAGLGVMLLAALGIFLHVGIQVDNALKSLLSFACVAAGSVVFIATGTVEWVPAALLIVGSYSGGLAGAAGSRRLSQLVLRRIMISLGTIVAIVLAIRTYL